MSGSAAEHNSKKRARGKGKNGDAPDTHEASTAQGSAPKPTQSPVKVGPVTDGSTAREPEAGDQNGSSKSTVATELRPQQQQTTSSSVVPPSRDQPPRGFQFDSEAANLEYAVLDSILADIPSLSSDSGGNPTTATESWVNSWNNGSTNPTLGQSLDAGDLMDFSMDPQTGTSAPAGGANSGNGSMLFNTLQQPGGGGAQGFGNSRSSVGTLGVPAGFPASAVYDLVSQP